ncbi:GntR family transcriptional regulator [Sulfobacillus harzensis]|jgi:DNA-binding transcriptional regulator YhcF (GntR family)|uniref:GntR family transcriptional regulator n=1 Tax=Sulfobacillus harzensis TaxID=2729629 RepID=A0A7Y0L6Q2_9FIRM|nr:GntR family transcriptional regulator [Sulfobacillus harzensis]NMP24329.1 GntR family transcriptional regulator [Sulfobacillus harzensis]
MFVVVDWEDRRPAYLQIRDQVVEGIAQGGLKPGDRLPSVRRLASQLGLNLHTVHKAFELLQQEEFIRLTPRSGAVVCPRTLASDETAATLYNQIRPLLAEHWVRGLDTHAIMDVVQRCLNTFTLANVAALSESGNPPTPSSASPNGA